MKKLLGLTLALVVLFPISSRAEDVNIIFKKVNDLIAAKNFSKALEELGWAQKEIEKMNVVQIQSFFPDELAGFTGTKFETNNTLGLSNIERTYSKAGEKGQIKVSLAGSSNGAAAGGLGGLAAFGRMAAMMGGQGNGQDTIRIAGRTATLKDNDGGEDSQLTVFLDSGSVLTLDGTNGAAGSTLRSLADALKINDLDNYLRGQS